MWSEGWTHSPRGGCDSPDGRVVAAAEHSARLLRHQHAADGASMALDRALHFAGGRVDQTQPPVVRARHHQPAAVVVRAAVGVVPADDEDDSAPISSGGHTLSLPPISPSFYPALLTSFI